MSASLHDTLTNWREAPDAVREGPDSTSPEGLAIAWLSWLRDVKGRSPRTIDSYGVIVRQYLAWCYDIIPLEPLAPDVTDLERFVTRPRIRQARGQMGSAATRRQDVVVLQQWFQWLLRRGHLRVDPTVDLCAPSVKPNMPKPIPDADWLVLWTGVTNQRLRLAMGLGYYCGLRRKEITELRGAQITDETIVSFVRKGGGEDSLPWRSLVGVYAEHMPHLALNHEQFAAELQAHARSMGTERLFWTDGQQMRKNMTKLCARVGTPHYTPHQLRHSFVTNLLRARVPPHLVMSLANHTKFDMTKRYMKAGGTELDEWRRGLNS